MRPVAGVRALLAGLALPVLVAGCLTRSERSRVDAWLTCEDCTDHEADSVRAIGGRWWRRPFLLWELRRDLVKGPEPARIPGLAPQLGATWARDKAYGLAHARPSGAPLPDSAEFVRAFLENFGATYRIRAAISVYEVAGVPGLPPVDSSPDSAIRGDVRTLVARLRAGVHP